MNLETSSPTSSARRVAQSMSVLEARFEAVAANLANASTPGYKRLVSAESRFARELAGAVQSSGTEVNLRRHMQAGNLVETGDPFEFSLQGEGMFAVEFDGQTLYTRHLQTHVDRDGNLLDRRGMRVLGDAGPVALPGPGAKVEVNEDGLVQVEGQVLDRLQLLKVPPAKLHDAGPGLYSLDSQERLERATETAVRPGFREQSNVEPMLEMIQLISLQRQFQATQRVLRLESDLSSRLAQSLR